MNNTLLLVLSIIGLLALYWVLFGQWKWNKMMIAEKEDNAGEKKDETDNI